MRHDALILACLSISVVISLHGCSSHEAEAQPEVLSWEDFRNRARVEFAGRVIYRVDWDIAVDEKDLRARYEQYVNWHDKGWHGNEATSHGVGVLHQPSIVNLTSGQRDVWGSPERFSLTYCVSTEFAELHNRAVSEMLEATRSWEHFGFINFEHVAAEDDDCSNANPAVLFAVRPWSAGGACAFFPSGSGCLPRTVVIDYNDFDTNPVWATLAPNLTTAGVLRHELGHVLGFRHEHTHVSGTGCWEDANWDELTTYDPRSVMHYQWCNGVSSADLMIAPLDAVGVRTLYRPYPVVTRATFEDGMTPDFNGDGLTDIALIGSATWTQIPVATSQADGNWSTTHHDGGNVALQARTGDVKPISGDFNGDGLTDIALVGPGRWWQIPVAYAVGDGTWRTAESIAVPFPQWVATENARVIPGDFDDDGRTDLAVSGPQNWTQMPIMYARDSDSWEIVSHEAGLFASSASEDNVRFVSGDFNGDGRSDVALVGGETWDFVVVAFMLAGGGLDVVRQPMAAFAAKAALVESRVAAGDFNGDGLADMALVGAPGWTTVAVALSAGDGNFDVVDQPAGLFADLAANPNARVVVGDTSGDGMSDMMLVGGAGWDTIPVALASGDGTFFLVNEPSPVFAFQASTGAQPLVGDFNGDSLTDIALTGNPSWATVPVAMSDGDGTFSTTDRVVGSFALWAAMEGVRIVN